jgi:hypothetical protein
VGEASLPVFLGLGKLAEHEQGRTKDNMGRQKATRLPGTPRQGKELLAQLPRRLGLTTHGVKMPQSPPHEAERGRFPDVLT